MEGLIPEVVISDNNDIITPQFAELANKDEAEDKPFVISFKKYNESLCGIKNISFANVKNILEIMKYVGTSVLTENDFGLLEYRTRHIVDENDYSKLYNKLRDNDDINLYEIYLTDKKQDTARIFYFNTMASKTMHIVAITNKHFETNKQRS
jgi:hypothetical protein